MNLFSLFNSKFNTVENNPFEVDIHSHLLPRIDDGVQSLKESLELIKKFKLLGYKKLITTPHIISDYYQNDKEIITKKLNIVQNALKEENIDIQLEAGAEYYVDMKFLELIEEEKLVTFMSHYVLFETSYTEKPIILELVIEALLKKGYIPVLAHPERYRYLHNDIELYKMLKARGVLFQLNAKSLYHKSKSTHKIAIQLISSGLIDFIGSDAHRMRDVNRLESFLKSKTCRKMIKLNHIQNNLIK
ncbi:MAG TPA: capsular biosynthesis protein [Bacteroidetes bacterium]|nr:capsular biosynthesis protein [Bacteroidota bacterium]